MDTKYQSVRCPICDSVGKWKNVDQYRYKPSEMHLCLKCGFVTYPDVINAQNELKEFYREEYREAPTVGNIHTGERKLHYHAAFLKPLFDEWTKAGKNPTVCEIGSAFGMFLNWMREIFPKGEFNGTELTQSYVRNAYHLYGLKLRDAIDTTKKYDFIATYKVAEHQPEIDKELKKYAECLTDDGLLYISVPTWFHGMCNFGAPGFAVEYYYSKNHVNVWTRKLFETLLAKCGFEIVRANYIYYDSTYLCKKAAPGKSFQPQYEDPAKIEQSLDAVFRAAKAFDEGKYDDALEIYPNFPNAHSGRYEGNRSKFHKNGFDWIEENVIQHAIRCCPDSAQMRLLGADICMRYSKWETATKYLSEALKMSPNDPNLLLNLANCYRYMSQETTDLESKKKLLVEARDVSKYLKTVSLQASNDAITWIMQDNARIPTPFESPEPAVK